VSLTKLQDMLGIWLPVGGQVQQATGQHSLCKQVQERRLNNASLVMALFVPGVRKIDSDLCKTACGNLVADKFHRISAGYSNVIQAVGFQGLQQVTDTGFVNFDADEVLFRLITRHAPGGFAVPKTDFNDQRCYTAKQLPVIYQAGD